MTHGIHESLESLAVDIDTLVPLGDNPRRGNVEAIMSSYEEFGQIKPIVVRPNDDGTATVIAGNHQLEAAKRLGWDKIAVVEYDVDDKRAIAFALADNRTMELGYTEPEMLNHMILEINDVYPELLDGLGWDEFDISAVEQKVIREDNAVIDSGGYTPPVADLNGNGFTSIRNDDYNDDDEDGDFDGPVQDKTPTYSVDSSTVGVEKNELGESQMVAREGVNQRDAIIRGSTTVSPSSAPRAIVQYTIVFEDTAQQSKWYDFVRWLKSDDSIVGSTLAEKLLDFISQHTEI